MAFLSHAGYRMASVYGRQFHKLMQHLAAHYLPPLEAKAEKDISECVYRVDASKQYTSHRKGKVKVLTLYRKL